LPSQLWGELGWWSIAVTIITAYALFALAEVGLEIENVSFFLKGGGILRREFLLIIACDSHGEKDRTIWIWIGIVICYG